MEITINVKVEDQDIDDILVTALGGGINYWCGKVEIMSNPQNTKYASDVISKGGTLAFYDVEDEDDVTQMTLENFEKGLNMYLNDHPDCVYNGGLDCGNIDADGADMIVQYALFGEIVFG